MKITILQSCAGHDGEHLEAPQTLEYPDDAAKALIRTGRAVIADAQAAAEEAAEDATDSAIDELMKNTKDQLLAIAADELVEANATMNKAQIVEAILLKRSH